MMIVPYSWYSWIFSEFFEGHLVPSREENGLEKFKNFTKFEVILFNFTQTRRFAYGMASSGVELIMVKF